MKRIFLVLCCLVLFGLCLHARPQQEAAGPLRFGSIPGIELLPILHAKQRGYFVQEGVDFELIAFNNAQERDAALQADRIDGTLSDTFGAAFLVAAGLDFKVTSLTNDPFFIITSPQSGITNLAQLRGKRIGLFSNTVTHFVADSLLASVGVTEYEVVHVPNVMLRLEMVMNGQIDGALVPDPIMTTSMAQGAVLVGGTVNTTLAAGAYIFYRKVMDTRLNDVRAFYRAYYRAIIDINANPDSFRDFMVEYVNFPPSIRNTYKFVTYSKPRLPSEQQLRTTIAWLKRRDLLTANLTPSDIADPRAVSEWSN